MISVGLNRNFEIANILPQQSVGQARGSNDAGAAFVRMVKEGAAKVFQSIGDRVTQITGHGSSQAVFAAQNPYVQALAQPYPHENGLADNGIIARHEGRLMAKMEAYAKSCGSKLTSDQIRAFINTGENVINALNTGGLNEKGDTITVSVGGKRYDVKSSLHTTRAISWYLAAKAAEQELLLGGDHLVGKGSMIMSDPGNKLFRFLNAAPTAYGRVSTHFNERHDGAMANVHNVGFCGLFTRQAAQRGIEDFQRMFPSERGSLCFDKLVGKDGSPQLFMKFEAVGMPTVFRLSGHGESHEGRLQKLGNAFASIRNCILHACNLVTSRFDKAHGPEHVHKEHVHKGVPKTKVMEPFRKLMAQVDTSHPEAATTVAGILAGAKKHGIAHIEDVLNGFERFNLKPKPGVRDFQEQLAAVKNQVEAFHNSLGPDFGVARKGNETHITLEPHPKEMFLQSKISMDPLETIPL